MDVVTVMVPIMDIDTAFRVCRLHENALLHMNATALSPDLRLLQCTIITIIMDLREDPAVLIREIETLTGPHFEVVAVPLLEEETEIPSIMVRRPLEETT